MLLYAKNVSNREELGCSITRNDLQIRCRPALNFRAQQNGSEPTPAQSSNAYAVARFSPYLSIPNRRIFDSSV
jgi:hypothetical protein